jgi:glycosyltransferase involved in cell wall biosynthesis
MSVKVIGVLPLKNEDWILEYTLACLSEFCDEIIALDDGSTDRSLDILKQCEKVVKIIANPPRSAKFRNEPKNWNRLTRAAIERGADWIFYTDADEMVSKNIIETLPSLVANAEVGVYQFKKISPWRGLTHYRSENEKWVAPPENALNPILIRATNDLFWTNPKGSFIKRIAKFILRGERFRPTIGRVFPKGVFGKRIGLNEIVAVHFNNLSYQALIKKQLNYAVNEVVERPKRGIEDIVEWAFFRLDESNIELREVEQGWIWPEFEHLIKRNCD